MNLKSILISERSWSQKTTCMINLYDILKKLKIRTEVLWNKKQISSCWGNGQRQQMTKKRRSTRKILGDKTILYPIYSDEDTILHKS